MQESKFVIDDLWCVLDHVKDCFPKTWEIFNVFEDQYKKNVEKIILPILEKDMQSGNNFGSLVNLLNWVEQYKRVMKRAGIQEGNGTPFLYDKVIKYMPQFLDKMKNDFKRDIIRAIESDKSEFASLD